MKVLSIAFVLVTACVVTAHADTLLLEAIESAPANAASGVARPTRGATMDAVKARFGEPASVKPAVGEPPITRWVFAGYTVYFESDRVIDVVVHR